MKLKKTIVFLIPIIIIILAFIILIPGTGNNNKKVNMNYKSVRRELYDNLYRNGGIIIYAVSNPVYANNYLTAAEKIQQRFNWAKLKIKPDTSITGIELKSDNLIIIGTIHTNKILRKIDKYLPVKFTGKEFFFNGKSFNQKDAVVNLFYFNPFNKNKLCYIISGNNNRYVSGENYLRSIGDVRIIENGKCSEMGFFKTNSNGRWVIDKNRVWDFSGEKKVYNNYKDFRYIVYSKKINQTLTHKINIKNEKLLDSLKIFFNDRINVPKINYYIYNNFEDKGLISGNTELSNYNIKDTSVSTVINSWINGNDFFKTAELILRLNLGKPNHKFIETGLSLYFSDHWRRKGYKFWAALLYKAGDIPSLQKMMNNKKLNYISSLISEPLAASFVSYLIKNYGEKNFINNYIKWNPDESKLIKLNSGWKKYLAKLLETYKDSIKRYEANFPDEIPKFQKGFCFAHEGYDIYNGYLSHDAVQSILKIKKLGANSFSITPFTSMRDAQKPVPLRFWEFAGAENDESLIFLSHLAKKLNMNVILKPQIYLGRNGWPGDIKMNNKNDWNKFFHYYFNWIEHYAMLAEMYRIPLLCIGNELAGATIGHEKDWVNMIGKIRKLYDGKLVYGANWSGEFEQVTFWKYMDYIGISEYFPLSEKNDPTNEQLYNGAKEAMKKIYSVEKKYNKPVIFTEVGFRSTGEPWKTAVEKGTRNKVNLQNQKRCYEELFKAAFGRKWLAGMYWWKWPSYLSYGGSPENTHYTPNNKPAEGIVKKWYTKSWK